MATPPDGIAFAGTVTGRVTTDTPNVQEVTRTVHVEMSERDVAERLMNYTDLERRAVVQMIEDIDREIIRAAMDGPPPSQAGVFTLADAMARTGISVADLQGFDIGVTSNTKPPKPPAPVNPPRPTRNRRRQVR